MKRQVSFARFFDVLDQEVGQEARLAINQLLVIGPGRYDPLTTLLDWSPKSKITAIEIDLDIAALLQADHASFPRLYIVGADSTELRRVAPGPYNLICIRHPDIDAFPQRWAQVLSAAVDNLDTCGLLIITTYSLPECSALLDMLDQQNDRLFISQPRSNMPLNLAGNDRYAIAVRRTGVNP